MCMTNKKMIEYLRHNSTSLKQRIDGDPKNINPLQRIPEPQMRLYEIFDYYFDKKEDLEEYCKVNNLSNKNVYVVDFLGEVAGKTDVIRRTDSKGNSMFYTAVDRYVYGIYNYKRSIYKGEFVWNFNYGSIQQMYKPFRERGIVFNNDIYGELVESDQKIMKMIRDKNLFCYGNK